MSSRTTSFNVPEHILKKLDSRTDSVLGVSRSQTMAQDLDTFYALLETSMRKVRQVLTKQEALLILDAINGTIVEAGQAAELWMGTSLQHQIVDAIAYNDLSQKWEVDRDTLLDKLNSLEHFERYALVDWVKNMWNKTHDHDPVEKGEAWDKELSRFQGRKT